MSSQSVQKASVDHEFACAVEFLPSTCLQFLQAISEGHVERPLVVAREIHSFALAQFVILIRSRELGGLMIRIRLVHIDRVPRRRTTHDDHEVPVLTLLHPFSNPLLRLLVLVVIRPTYQPN